MSCSCGFRLIDPNSLHFIVNGKPEPLQSDDVKLIKSELRHIRDICTQLFDRLDDRPPENGPVSADSTTPRTPKGTIVYSSNSQTIDMRRQVYHFLNSLA